MYSIHRVLHRAAKTSCCCRVMEEMWSFVDRNGEEAWDRHVDEKAWDRHVDEKTKLAYWYNGVTGESLWEEVPGFHPHDDGMRQVTVPPQRQQGSGGGGGASPRENVSRWWSSFGGLVHSHRVFGWRISLINAGNAVSSLGIPPLLRCGVRAFVGLLACRQCDRELTPR